MMLSFVPVVLGSHLLIAAAGLPGIDPQKLCHGSDLGGGPMQTFQSCMMDEQEAREKLLKDWGTYPSSDKAFCMRTNDYLPSYVEWITCAEMARDLRQLRKENRP